MPSHLLVPAPSDPVCILGIGGIPVVQDQPWIERGARKDAMPKTIDVDAARRQLTAERDRLVDLHASVDGTVAEDLGELSSADQHPADTGSETFERSKQASIRAQLEAELADLDRAIDRVERGRYGACEACGGSIGAERLAARPTARFCVDDQAAYERDRSRNGAIR